VTRRHYRRSKLIAVMRVFVFGAGASHDAGYPLTDRLGCSLDHWINSPPSADKARYQDGLEQIARAYPTLDTFEKILEGLRTCRAGSPAAALSTRPDLLTHLQEAIRAYFDSIRSRAVPSYDEFATLLRPGDLVITFNYELAVERALRTSKLWDIRTGYGFRIVPTEDNSHVEVLKLHGSTNWRALVAGGKTGLSAVNGNSLGNRPVLWSRQDLEYLDHQDFVDPLCAHLDSAATLSTSIMPVMRKTFHFETPFGDEWKGFWDHLWHRAGSAIERAEELVVIGYSLPMGDRRARKMFWSSANRTVRITICCGRDTTKLEETFRKHGFRDIRQAGGENKFKDFLARAAAEDGARADAWVSRRAEHGNTAGRDVLFPDLYDPDPEGAADEETEEIKRESIDKQVFIFNVGPLSHARPMSSYGTITIPALEASSCLHSDLRVAGPVTIPGRPSECYPDPFSDKRRRLYHQPIDGTPPGIDFALQVIGADRRGAMSGDLRSEGVFISQVRVPSKKHILRAQRRLRETAQARCKYLSQRSEAGDRVPITERDRSFARLLNDNARWVQAYDAQS
jgi:hypothetical protein